MKRAWHGGRSRRRRPIGDQAASLGRFPERPFLREKSSHQRTDEVSILQSPASPGREKEVALETLY